MGSSSNSLILLAVFGGGGFAAKHILENSMFRIFALSVALPLAACGVAVEKFTQNPTQSDAKSGGAGRMLLVPAGEFTMGSNFEQNNEMPVHQVHLDAFAIDTTEVTVSAYKLCVDAGKCSVPKLTDPGCNWGKVDRGEHPINCVDWHQSVRFCNWRGKRLPTEAEWEKAARGPKAQKYSWGDSEPNCTLAVMEESDDGCGRGGTWPVGSKPKGASPYGVLDMTGNVWEWTADWFGESYYASSPSRNPLGPTSGPGRVKRGGAWYFHMESLRAADREFLPPDLGRDNLGFRCAKSGAGRGAF